MEALEGVGFTHYAVSNHYFLGAVVQVGYFKNFVSLSNQRTSGPVNTHLTPGPGIYFNAFTCI